MRIAAAGALLAAGAAYFGFRPPPDDSALDPRMFAVFPFQHPRNDSLPELHGDDCQLMLTQAIAARWTDIHPPDPMSLKSAYTQYLAGQPSLENTMAAARQLGAGMAVMGEIHTLLDSVIFEATLYNVALGRKRDKTVRFSVARTEIAKPNLRAKFAMLADSLLPDRGGVAARVGAEQTSSVEAINAYYAGYRALSGWEIDSAAALFQQAVNADTNFASANYWLAQTQEWAQSFNARPAWGIHAERALRRQDQLLPGERTMAYALAGMAGGQLPAACDTLRATTRREPRNYVALYALSDCINRDNLVLPDPRSPTRWRFRSSGGEAIRTMMAALTAAPQSYRAFRGQAFARLERQSYSQSNFYRRGWSRTGRDSAEFGAFPALNGDTLVFWPGPIADFQRGINGTRPPTHAMAVAQTRDTLRRLTREWAVTFPDSPDAIATYAAALERVGRLVAAASTDTAALDMIRAARRRNPSIDLDTELAYTEVRVLVKAADYEGAARIGDSLLTATQGPALANNERLAGVAALLGRESLAVSLWMRTADVYEIRVAGKGVRPPSQIAREALRLAAFAAAENVDSAAASRRRLITELRAGVAPAQVAGYERAILSSPFANLYVSLPGARREIPDSTAPSWLVDLQVHHRRGDGAAVRHKIDSALAAGRDAGRLRVDPRFAYHAARLALLDGDTARATALLDASIAAIPMVHEAILRSIGDAFAIPNILALRAELDAPNSPTARRLARGALLLWLEADPRYRTTVDRLRRIVATSP